MDKQITVLYLENNPLDRAVLDLHISQGLGHEAVKFQLRYSYDGRLLEAKDVVADVVKGRWKPSSAIILFDLGLSGGSENLLPDPAVRKVLGDQFLTKYLTSEGRRVSPNKRFESFKNTYPAASEYVEKIEGLSTLLKVRFAHPDILCGIVSHYVGDDIRDVLEAFVMQGWPIDSTSYDEDEQPKPLVIHKGDLVGINQRLKSTWEAWQAVRIEFYCKDVVQNSLTQDASGSSKSLAERVDLIRADVTLQPDDYESPIFICDFLGLLDLPHATLTLERLLKKLFRSMKVVKAKDLSAMEQGGQYLFLDTEDRNLALKDAIEQLRSAHNQQNPAQLVCVVRGGAGTEAEALQLFEDLKLNTNCWYIVPSMPAVMSAPTLFKTFAFDRFVKAMVTSACEHTCFVRASKVEVDERFLSNLEDWLRNLPKKAVPASLITVWNCLCEVFEKQILTKTKVETLFAAKAKEEAGQREKRGNSKGVK